LSLLERRAVSPTLIGAAARLLDQGVLPEIGPGMIRRAQAWRLRQTLAYA
jgi:hypothetical protein